MTKKGPCILIHFSVKFPSHEGYIPSGAHGGNQSISFLCIDFFRVVRTTAYFKLIDLCGKTLTCTGLGIPNPGLYGSPMCYKYLLFPFIYFSTV